MIATSIFEIKFCLICERLNNDNWNWLTFLYNLLIDGFDDNKYNISKRKESSLSSFMNLCKNS